MALIKLNDLEVEVPDGINVVEAARMHGIEVPHYCYHPGLSSPANCRMCLVEPHVYFPARRQGGARPPVGDGVHRRD